MDCDQKDLLKKRKKKCEASPYWIDNPQINWNQRGRTDVKETDFLLIMQRNRNAK